MPKPKLNVRFNLFNPEVEKFIDKRTYEFAKESTNSLLDKLRDVWNDYLKEGMKEGKTIFELTDDVEEVFQGTEREEWFRARRIARTEVVGASNMAGLFGMEQAGVPYKTWASMEDEFVRDSHASMNGVTIPIDEDFIVDGKSMSGPGDADGGPEEICNCRCTLLSSFGEEA